LRWRSECRKLSIIFSTGLRLFCAVILYLAFALG
jgi:hypothetical protein